MTVNVSTSSCVYAFAWGLSTVSAPIVLLPSAEWGKDDGFTRLQFGVADCDNWKPALLGKPFVLPLIVEVEIQAVVNDEPRYARPRRSGDVQRQLTKFLKVWEIRRLTIGSDEGQREHRRVHDPTDLLVNRVVQCSQVERG